MDAHGGGDENLSRVKCPYFLSRTNGHKLYINCSTEEHINETSLRKEFNYIESRKVCFGVNCCDDFYHCDNYVKLKGSEKIATDTANTAGARTK
jgi:hypothetical protein